MNMAKGYQTAAGGWPGSSVEPTSARVVIEDATGMSARHAVGERVGLPPVHLRLGGSGLLHGLGHATQDVDVFIRQVLSLIHI